jgi:hypothetical protein
VLCTAVVRAALAQGAKKEIGNQIGNDLFEIE